MQISHSEFHELMYILNADVMLGELKISFKDSPIDCRSTVIQ